MMTFKAQRRTKAEPKRDTQLEANIAAHRNPGERVLMRLAYANSFRSKIPLALIGGRYDRVNFHYMGQPRWALSARRCEVRFDTVHQLAADQFLERDWDSTSVVFRITRKGKRRVASLMHRLSGKVK